MKKIEMFNSLDSFTSFINRKDIEVITVEIKVVEQSMFFQENFAAVVFYKENTIKNGKIVCYCGSLRFKNLFEKYEYESVFKGEIALLPCCMFVDIEREYGAESDYKRKADDLHKQKIGISDEVFVLNVGGYIGQSTRSEIDYALSIGKPVFYLEP